jgi:hypothetical protein
LAYRTVLQSCGVGGKTYDIIKSMYTGNTSSIKIGKKRTEFFNQGRGLRQGCNLSPALFNIYINELATVQKLNAYSSQSPTTHGLQQSLDLLEQYCQTLALAINPKNTKILIFQRRSRSQGIRPKFSIGTKYIEY